MKNLAAETDDLQIGTGYAAINHFTTRVRA